MHFLPINKKRNVLIYCKFLQYRYVLCLITYNYIDITILLYWTILNLVQLIFIGIIGLIYQFQNIIYAE
jgi:hypothetical protein